MTGGDRGPGLRPGGPGRADTVCNGRNDVAVLAVALAAPEREVELCAGTVRPERRVHLGREPVPAAGRERDRPGRRPGPHPARGRAGAVPDRGRRAGRDRREPRRVRLRRARGHADRFTAEDVYVTHSLDGGATSDFGRKGGCTAAFMAWGRKGRTLRDLDVPPLLGRAVVPPRLQPEPRRRERGRRLRGHPL